MALSEWSLVLFTLLAQISVGVVSVLLLVEIIYPSRAVFTRLRVNAGSLALACMALALIFSFLHLGSPFRAYYALSNLGTSWLSMEIFMASVFLGLLFIWWMSLRRTWLASGWMIALETLMVISGLLLIYAMARVYMIPTLPLWDTPGTILRFFASAYLLGPVAVLFILERLEAPQILEAEKGTAARVVLAVALLMAVLRLMVIWLFYEPAIAGPSGMEMPGMPLFFSALQVGLLLAGGLVAGRWGYQVLVLRRNKPARLAWAFTLFLVAELLGRYFFYANFYRLGL